MDVCTGNSIRYYYNVIVRLSCNNKAVILFLIIFFFLLVSQLPLTGRGTIKKTKTARTTDHFSSSATILSRYRSLFSLWPDRRPYCTSKCHARQITSHCRWFILSIHYYIDYTGRFHNHRPSE